MTAGSHPYGSDDVESDSFFEGLMVDGVQRLVAAGMAEADAIDKSVSLVYGMLPQFAEKMRASLHASKSELLNRLAADRADFEQIIADDYGTALNNFEAVAYLSYELGLNLHEIYVRSGVADRHIASCQVLFLLHGRACTVAREVLHLLRGDHRPRSARRHSSGRALPRNRSR